MKKFRPKQSISTVAGQREEVGVFALLWLDRMSGLTYIDARGSYMELKVELTVSSKSTATMSGGSDAV